jgi:zeta-carotene desaturase
MAEKNSGKTVCVIGGGIAGLSSAVFLAEKGFKVTLVEASPKIGGRTYSFFDKLFGGVIDNGQHILAGWYNDTFSLLKLTGSFDKLSFQEKLEIQFADVSGARYTLKASNLPAPFHLAGGILGYKALGFKDKRALIKLVNGIKRSKWSSEELKNINTDEFFRNTGQTPRLIEYFWKPFIVAVFNAEPENTSALLFAQMIKRGFIDEGGSGLVLPNGFLNEIFTEPAREYLNSKDCVVYTNRKADEFCIKDRKVTSLILEDNSEIKTDYYVCAVPFFEVPKLFANNYGEVFEKKFELKASPIVNIHLKFDRNISNIISGRFIGLLGTGSQWVFKVKEDQVCVVISAAEKTAEMTREAITEGAVNDLNKCLPEFKEISVVSSRVLKEMRATIVPDKYSLNNRPSNLTKLENLVLAGDWTDTGLPSTIEGAVKSGKKCAEIIENK